MSFIFALREPVRDEPAADVEFGPFDLDSATRFEEAERERSLFLGDLVGAALVAGAAAWSLAASLA